MVPNHNYTETYLYWIKIDKNAFNNLSENFEFLKELKENCIQEINNNNIIFLKIKDL